MTEETLTVDDVLEMLPVAAIVDAERAQPNEELRRRYEDALAKCVRTLIHEVTE